MICICIAAAASRLLAAGGGSTSLRAYVHAVARCSCTISHLRRQAFRALVMVGNRAGNSTAAASGACRASSCSGSRACATTAWSARVAGTRPAGLLGGRPATFTCCAFSVGHFHHTASASCQPDPSHLGVCSRDNSRRRLSGSKYAVRRLMCDGSIPLVLAAAGRCLLPR